MSQADDLAAIHSYITGQQPVTSKAAVLQQDWRQWYEPLTWWQKNMDADIPAVARRKRDDYNAANGSAIVQTAQGSQVIRVAPSLSSPYVPSAPQPTIRKGSTGDAVKIWQNVVGASPVDGKYGGGTEALTKAWQKARALTPDGVVGAASWARALKEYQAGGGPATDSTAAVRQAASLAAATVGKPPAVITSGAKPTIKKGSSGAAVKEWQAFIGATPVDGKFGGGTDSLTRAWQKARNLTADGVVGPASWARAQTEYQAGKNPAAAAALLVSQAANKAAATKATPAAQKAAAQTTVKKAVVAAAKEAAKPASSPPVVTTSLAKLPAKAAKKTAAAVTATTAAITSTTAGLPLWGKVALLATLGSAGLYAIHQAATSKPHRHHAH